MKFDIKKLIPPAVAILLFICISVFYFKPVVFDKKELKQGDIINFKGMSKEIADFRAETKQEPLWTNSMFGGMPAYQISTLYPNNWLKYIDKAFSLGLPHPVGQVCLYFIGFYILLACLRINPWLAIVGALAFGFSSYFFIILEAGHNSKAHAIGYMAPLLGSIILTLRGKRILGASLTALFMGLELYCNHVQITYYFFILVFIILLFELGDAIQKKTVKSFFTSCVFIGMATVIGLLPNITSLWATYEYGKFSTRGATELTIKSNKESNDDIKTKSGLNKDYATQWSYGVDETFTLLIPNFKGGASEPISKGNKDALKKVNPEMRDNVGGFGSYFGDQPFTSGPVYAGAIMFVLALLGLFVIKGPLKWALLVGTLLTIMLSWGKNFMGLSNLFFDYVPGYNKFRAVSMILVIAELTIPLLAILAIDSLIKNSAEGGEGKIKPVFFLRKVFSKEIKITKITYIVFGVVAGFLLLCWLMPGMFNTFQGSDEFAQIVASQKQSNPKVSQQEIENYVAPFMAEVETARETIFKADVARTLLFVILTAVVVILFIRKTITLPVLGILLGVFVLADMWPVAARYLNKENYVSKPENATPFFASKADEFILSDKTPDFRVLKLGNPFNDASASYFHKSIGGYHGAKLKRYAELIDFRIDPEYANVVGALRVGATDSSIQAMFKKQYTLNMLNAKYVIYDPESPPLINKSAFGNAWFVTKVNYVPDADKEITTLGEINPRWYAVVNEKFKPVLNGFDPVFDSTATIKLTSYAPNKLVYETNAKKDQLAVFSEIYYPKGWNAYIDGALTEHINADYVLRAMKVPAGKHVIEYRFEPEVYANGEKIAMAGSILLVLLVVGGIIIGYRKEIQTT
ncbi:MAG: hypothetical protein K0S33_2178 [Bacteroidetes bacterium]|jgi:hypothetical protein|nr:hypothetical protein [Bacteroidota bacterium]